MQISKERLKELESQAEYWKTEADALSQSKYDLERRCITFDRILDKVEKAAVGLPLTLHEGGYGNINGSSEHHGCCPDRLTEEEKREREFVYLRERLIEAERRLSAVVAVAQFAKEHKA